MYHYPYYCCYLLTMKERRMEGRKKGRDEGREGGQAGWRKEGGKREREKKKTMREHHWDKNVYCLLNNAECLPFQTEGLEEGLCNFAFFSNRERQPGGRVAAGGRVSPVKKKKKKNSHSINGKII